MGIYLRPTPPHSGLTALLGGDGTGTYYHLSQAGYGFFQTLFSGTAVVSASTFVSGSTDLGQLLGGVSTFVQPGTNILTGGTSTRPIVSVVSSPSFVSLSAETIYSGNTDLSQLIVPTLVQQGTNILVGGTSSAPIVSLRDGIILTSISAVTITATTFFTEGIQQSNTTSVRLEESMVTNSTSYIDITGLGFTLQPTTTYSFIFIISWTSGFAGTGVGFSINGPSSPSYFSALMQTHQRSSVLTRFITVYDDGTAGVNVDTINLTYTATIIGNITTGASGGDLIARVRRGGAENSISVFAGSNGSLTKLSSGH